jgi:hypothetical protein
MLYLTPDRYRTMGFGTDLDELSDIELRSLLTRASAAVDAYCAVPKHPNRYSFRGGKVEKEPHAFPIDDPAGAKRRVFLNSTPLKAVDKIRIYVTNQQYIEFGPNELFVARDWAEVISLAMTASGLFGALMIPNLGLGTPLLEAWYSYGYSFAEEDETLDPIDETNLVFQGQNQFWDPSVTAVVKVDGDETDDALTVNYEEGTITFEKDPAALVQVSYSYSLPYDIAVATALTATSAIGDHDLSSRGMLGLRSLKIAEMEMTRNPAPRFMPGMTIPAVPPEAALLLDPFRFITIRG